MRKTYFGFAMTFLVIGLIICFENIQFAAPIMIGFDYMGTSSIFFPLLIIMSIGFISGFFAGMGLMTRSKKDSADDEDDLDI